VADSGCPIRHQSKTTPVVEVIARACRQLETGGLCPALRGLAWRWSSAALPAGGQAGIGRSALYGIGHLLPCLRSGRPIGPVAPIGVAPAGGPGAVGAAPAAWCAPGSELILLTPGRAIGPARSARSCPPFWSASSPRRGGEGVLLSAFFDNALAPHLRRALSFRYVEAARSRRPLSERGWCAPRPAQSLLPVPHDHRITGLPDRRGRCLIEVNLPWPGIAFRLQERIGHGNPLGSGWSWWRAGWCSVSVTVILLVAVRRSPHHF